MKQPKYQFNVIAQRYSSQQDLDIDPGCNGYTARNIGDTPVTVNGTLLLPTLVAGGSGESFAVSGNLGEVFRGRVTIIFGAPAGTNPLVEIHQKFYLPETLSQL